MPSPLPWASSKSDRNAFWWCAPVSAKSSTLPPKSRWKTAACFPQKAQLPPDLPLGYHTVRYGDGRDVRCIVTPRACYLPPDLRIWGWSAQLYALRSAQSWGMGDFADLRRLARWSRRELGAGMLLVNPLCASTPFVPQQPSPYFPSSRRFRNPLYLRIEEIPGAAEITSNLEPLAQSAAALNQTRQIDRDAIFKLKMRALELLWERFNDDAAFAAFCAEQGEGLAQFAIFSALAEHHGSGWHSWPAEHRHPNSPAVARFALEHAGRVRFHQWVQWLLDRQLHRAADEIGLMQDLPIGVDPDGADAWAWQDLFASGATVGSPPDEYNTLGQNWGLPPFVPWKLREAGYQPFIQTIRGVLRHAGGLRIDHVMGLFRLFWIPDGLDPAQGAYVRCDADELLGILALESHRSKSIIVGEDLGSVEDGVRKRLRQCNVLSYRLVWFETDPPARFPQRALAAVTTHDLPTIAGLWTGSDLKAQLDLGLKPNEEGTQKIRDRLKAATQSSDNAAVGEVIERTHRLLADAPSMIVSATLDDAAAVEERPNMPGTAGDGWPNWSLALPKSLEEIERAELALTIAQALRRDA
jgi:4-alpha-glucanotransferase